MPRRHYTREQKAEAVALALVVGSPEAARQLGIGDPATVREWMRQAGKPTDIIAPTADMQALYDLALARTSAAVAAGKLSPVAMATVAGIAKRNLDRPAKDKPQQSALEACRAYWEWAFGDDTPLFGKDPTGDFDLEAEKDAFNAEVDAFEHILPELLDRANKEPGQPHRHAILVWFSHLPEIEAGDVLEWAKAQTLAILAEHGSWVAWKAFLEAREVAEREDYLAQVQRNKVGALLWRARSELNRTVA